MKIQNTVANHSPIILAAAGCLGFISAAIMSAKATPKAMEILDDLPEDSTKMDKVKSLAPVYSPTAAMLMISTACIVGANRIHTYRYGALLALYSIGERNLHRWQSSVLEEVGKRKYENVKERVLEPDKPVPDPVYIGKDRVLFFDNFTGRYFTANSVETVRRIINDMNEQLFSDDFVSVNEFYHELQLPATEFGDAIGWHAMDGAIKAEFLAFIIHDTPAISVTFNVKPRNYKG